MILLDTGPLVALFDRHDAYRELCQESLGKITEPFITTWPVITETMHLLNFSHQAQDLCIDWVIKGGASVDEPSTSRLGRIRELMGQYQDVPMDFADASLVALAEQEKISAIFTLDHKDFRIYRPSPRSSFTLIPARL